MSARDDLARVIETSTLGPWVTGTTFDANSDAVLAWVRGLDPESLAEVIDGRVETVRGSEMHVWPGQARARTYARVATAYRPVPE